MIFKCLAHASCIASGNPCERTLVPTFWFLIWKACGLFVYSPAIELVVMVRLRSVLFVMRFLLFLYTQAFSLITPYFGFTAEISWNLKYSVLWISSPRLLPPHVILAVKLLLGMFIVHSHQLPLLTSRVKILCTTKQSKAMRGKAKWNALTAERKMKPRMQLHSHPQWIMYSTSEHRNSTVCVCLWVNWIWLHFANRDEIGACTEFTWNIDPICY